MNAATEPFSPPFIFSDPQNPRRLAGFDADFIAAWTKCLGVKYTWHPYQDVASMIAAVQSGREDLVQGELFVNPTRARQVDFVVYMKNLTGSAVAKGNPKGIKSLDDLCGKTDAQAVGVIEIPLVKAASQRCKSSGRPPVGLVVYKSNDLAVQALVTGRADAFVADRTYVENLAKRFPNRVQTAFTLDNHVNIGVAINKQEVDLRRAVLAAVTAIQRNGTEDRLLRKWGLDLRQAVPAQPAP